MFQISCCCTSPATDNAKFIGFVFETSANTKRYKKTEMKALTAKPEIKRKVEIEASLTNKIHTKQ